MPNDTTETVSDTILTCPICSESFAPKSNRQVFCSEACKQKNKRLLNKIREEGGDKKILNGRPVKKMSDDPKEQARYEAFLKQIPEIEWLATGTPLDELTKLPQNKISLLYGKYGIGKTTLAHLIAAKSGAKTLYIDTEASLTPERLFELGIDPERFDVVKVAFIEDVYDLMVKEDTLRNYDLIVWDSVANTSARTEYESDSTDRLIGAKALIMNKLMRIMPNQLDRFKTTLLLINQEREGIGMYAANYVPGGRGQMYSSSVVIRLAGNYPKIKAEITKSRVSDVGKLEFSL